MSKRVGLAMVALATVAWPLQARGCVPYLGESFVVTPRAAPPGLTAWELTIGSVDVSLFRAAGSGGGDCSGLSSATLKPALRPPSQLDVGYKLAFVGGTVPPSVMFPVYILAPRDGALALYWFEDGGPFDFEVALSAVHASGLEGPASIVRITGPGMGAAAGPLTPMLVGTFVGAVLAFALVFAWRRRRSLG